MAETYRKNMQIKIITFENFHGRKKGSMGSSMIRGEWLCNHWPEANLYTQGSYADVMIYQKVYWKYHMQDFKGVKILDLCDPDWIDGVLKLKEISFLVDAITTNTKETAEFVRNSVKNIPVVCIPDRIDLTQFPKDIKKHEKIAEDIVWFGYQNNANILLPPLLYSLAKKKLKLHVISDGEFRPLNDCGVEIIYSKYESDSAFFMIRQNDIVINPSMNIKKFRYKSNNKTLISWALGLPVAITMDELNRFMDPIERRKEIKKRQQEIKEKWDIKFSVEQYKNLIKQICEKKKICPEFIR